MIDKLRTSRDEAGRPWLAQAPAKISRLSVKGKQVRSYPLSWTEQNRLLKDMPRHLPIPCCSGSTRAVGSRRSASSQISKTSTERVVVLNAVAKRAIESRRGIHEDFVFTYRGHPMGKLNNTAWKRAWRRAGLPTEKGIRKGVHNLRHTFGRRLRSAGVPLETRKTLLGHADGDITTHYSAAELDELRQAAEKIVDARVAQTPTLMIVRRTGTGIGKVSAKAKRASAHLRLTL